jgi:hypothetical protein
MKRSRFDYVKFDHLATAMQAAAKRAVSNVEALVAALPDGRAKDKALDHLEETYMWMGKAIRDDQISRNNATELQEERGNS